MKHFLPRLSSPWSFAISLVIHLIVCLLLFFRIMYQGPKQVQKQYDHRAPVRFAQEPPQQSPSASTKQTNRTQDAPPPSPPRAEQTRATDTKPASMPVQKTTNPSRIPWNADKARAQWRKKTPEHQSATKQPSQSRLEPQASFHESRFNGQDPLAPEQPLTLQQKINKSWKEDRTSHYQYAIARAICYELNKQNIIDYPQFLPPAIHLSITLDTQGNLLEAFVDRSGLSPALHQALYQALCNGSPYVPAPASLLDGDRQLTLRFTIHADPQESSSPSQKIPIRFFIRN